MFIATLISIHASYTYIQTLLYVWWYIVDCLTEDGLTLLRFFKLFN